MKLIQKHLDEIFSICQRYNAKELYVFGSILTDKFNDTSDIDFLVRFEGVKLEEYFDNYMDFKEELEKLLSREIDLVEIQTIKNPILKRSIDRDKVIIYGGEDSKMAV